MQREHDSGGNADPEAHEDTHSNANGHDDPQAAGHRVTEATFDSDPEGDGDDRAGDEDPNTAARRPL